MTSNYIANASQKFYDADRQEYIASFIWERGRLSAAIFHKTSMEIFVAEDIFDLQPDYPYLHHLYRQFKTKEILCSGPSTFLKALMKLSGLDPEHDPYIYKINFQNPVTSSLFIVYPNNLKSLLINRKRIINLQYPGISETATENERKIFLETFLPIHSDLVVQSLGNLLSHLEANWRYLFLQEKPHLMIRNITVLHLKSQLLIDDTTYQALEIFSPPEHHPAGSKHGLKSSAKIAFSLYSIFSRYCTRIGKNTLKTILQQPTTDIEEILERQSIIEWCLKESNDATVRIFKMHLSQIYNIGDVYLKLRSNPAKVSEWKKLRESIWNIYCICRICSNICRNAEQSNLLFKELAAVIVEGTTLKDVLTVLEKILDIDESITKKRFVTKLGNDATLDDQKKDLDSIKSLIEDIIFTQIKYLPKHIKKLTSQYLAEIGILLGVSKDIDTISDTIVAFQQLDFKLMCEDKNELFFKSLRTEALNKQFILLEAEIYLKEQKICKRLILYLRDPLLELQKIVRLCAKLDTMISMRTIAAKMKLVKPTIVSEKVLEISNGKHFLLETMRRSVPNDTAINIKNKNFTTILTAPNSSGKSVYMKQLALIVYLGHIGSYVPANQAKIGILNAIYSKMYDLETVHHNASSFLIELQQLGKILSSSTDRSLILIDEFGKGTQPNEGKAILYAAIENLVFRNAKTPISIITTHYKDFIELFPSSLELCFKTFQVVQNTNGTIESRFKIIPGKNLSNYALDCAQIKPILDNLSNSEHGNELMDFVDVDDVALAKINYVIDILRWHINEELYEYSDVIYKLEHFQIYPSPDREDINLSQFSI